MPIWHRTAAAVTAAASRRTMEPRADNAGETTLNDNENRRSRRRYDHSTLWQKVQRVIIKLPLHKKLSLVALVVMVIMVCVHFLVWHEYAWVYHRCLLSWIVPTTEKQIFCQEAWSHMVANYDPALLWTPELVELSAIQQAQVDQALTDVRSKVAAGADPPIKNVHYTLTAPMDEPNTRDLGKCSIEAMAIMCRTQFCRVNIWVVDSAASAVMSELNAGSSNRETQPTNSVVAYLNELAATIESTAKPGDGQIPPQYCIRIINDPPSFDEEQRVPLSPLLSNMTAGCPKPTRRSHYAGKRMREWLGSHQAREQQIPEHASDAWRLVALLEWGGLYVDMDVLPLSPLLLRIPRESVPVQHRVGAYRVNGGVLRLGDGAEEDEAWAILEGMHESNLRKRLHRHNMRSTFLKAVEEDHMYWAPRLSRLPAEEQTFGFLGPAALTRVFSAHSSYTGKVTVLPKEVVEPIIGASLCREVKDRRSLAAHFSGKVRKKSWRNIMKRDKCLEKMMRDICPQTIGT